MILNREEGQVTVTEALVGTVVQISVSDFKTLWIKCRRVNCKAVVLRCDLNVIGQEILDGMITPAMTELEFECFPAEGQGKQLVSETNPEDRSFADKLLDILNGEFYRSRVAGTVGEKNTVRVHRKYIISRKLSGHYGHFASIADKSPQDIPLDAVVARDNIEAAAIATGARKRLQRKRRRVDLIPLIWFFASDNAGEIQSIHLRRLTDFPEQTRGIRINCRKHTAHSSFGTNHPREHACIDSLDGNDIESPEPSSQAFRCTEVAVHFAVFTDDNARDLWPCGLHIIEIDAVVPDHRIRHGHNLSGVGRVGEDFLVARETGIEDDLPCEFAFSTE